MPETLEEYCVRTQPKPSEEELDEFDLDDEGYPYEASGMLCIYIFKISMLQNILLLYDPFLPDYDEEYEENTEDSGQGEN